MSVIFPLTPQFWRLCPLARDRDHVLFRSLIGQFETPALLYEETPTNNIAKFRKLQTRVK